MNTNGRMLPRSGSRLLVGLTAMAVLAVASPLTPIGSTPAHAQQAGVPVLVATAQRQDIPVWLQGLGTVQAYYSVLLRPRVDGTLTQVPIKEGQDVKQGQLLAVIDPRPYQAALDAAIAKKDQDQAQLANAQADLSRYSSLVRQDFASRQQLDTQQAMVKQFIATIAGDEAQIETAQLNLSFSYITAPFDGRIGLRNVDPGNVVHASELTPILSITQVQPIALTFTLPQDNLASVTKALQQNDKPLVVVAFAPDDKTELARGTLLTVDNAIDTTTGTIKLKATFPNADRALWPGQFVHARVLIGNESGVVAVPTPAIQHGPDGLFVYQVKPDDIVSVQPVTVTREEAGKSVVSSGLSDGAVVVVAGQSRLQSGTKVAVHDQSAPPPAAKSAS